MNSTVWGQAYVLLTLLEHHFERKMAFFVEKRILILSKKDDEDLNICTIPNLSILNPIMLSVLRLGGFFYKL
jgi:hypothetical protein